MVCDYFHCMSSQKMKRALLQGGFSHGLQEFRSANEFDILAHYAAGSSRATFPAALRRYQVLAGAGRSRSLESF
jgi:hypothetical protein